MTLTELLIGATLFTAVVALLLLCLLLARQSAARREQHSAVQRQEQLINQVADELLEAVSRMRAELGADVQQQQSALGGLIGQSAQSQATLLESMQRQSYQQLGQLDARMEQLRQATLGSLTELRKENERQLTEMRKTVDEKLTESLDKRLNDSFAQVSRRLEQVYRGLGEMQTLASGVGDLKKVLTNVKTRGIWGEMQLGTLLSQVLAPRQYDENIAVIPGSAERVEFAIRLPGQGSEVMYLPIDSKFPQEDYIRLQDASQSGDAAQVEEARKALLTRIRTEAKRIAGKYIAAPHTTDFAIMFLPVEGLYAEVVRAMDVVESIQRDHRIVIAGPSTFAALLNALQMGFRTLAIEKRSSEVWQLLGAVKTDFGKFADVLEKTRQRLQQASESIDTAYTRTRSIQRRLGAVETEGALHDAIDDE